MKFDEAFTFKFDKAYTMKSWQSLDKVFTMKSWQSHDKAYTMKSWQIHEGEKLGEKTGEISPLHLNFIFGSFTLITKKSWQNMYEEVLKIQEGRKEVRKEVRSNLLP